MSALFGSSLASSNTLSKLSTQATSTNSNPFLQNQSAFGNAFGNANAASQPQPTHSAQPGTGAQLPVLSQSQAQLASSLWQPPKESPHQKPTIEQIRLIIDKLNPSNPQCALKHYFYNKVEEAAIPFYKPTPNENPREWEEALERKPATGFVPVFCTGFESLAGRLWNQVVAVAALLGTEDMPYLNRIDGRLSQINGSLDAVLARHELDTEARSSAALRRDVALETRGMGLAGRVQVLRNRGYALSGDEDELARRLSALERAVYDPAVSAREEELWSRLIGVKGWGEQATKEAEKNDGSGPEMDEETQRRIKKVLADYDVQIRLLRREMEGMIKAYEEWEGEESKYARGR